MTIVSWRNATLVLAAVCGFQRWQRCTHGAPATPRAAAAERPTGTTILPAAPSLPSLPTLPAGGDAPAARTVFGVKLPGWAARLAPQRGESMRAYRDRVLPLAELAIAPQRARVARMRDELALDPHARAALDAAVLESATAIENRVMQAIASGEVKPATFTPMGGIAIARDMLDIVDRGNTKFQDALTPDQRAQVASHRFDFADYLLFSAPWEDALRVLD